MNVDSMIKNRKLFWTVFVAGMLLLFAGSILISLTNEWGYEKVFLSRIKRSGVMPQSSSTDSKSNDTIPSDPDLLYSSRTTIGLCRTSQGDNGGTCYSKTSLYFSGKLVSEWSEVVIGEVGEERVTYPAVEKTLSKATMDKIIKQIRDSGILTKPCKAELVMDLYVNYFINLDGIEREIKFPGCETELNAINKLIE